MDIHAPNFDISSLFLFFRFEIELCSVWMKMAMAFACKSVFKIFRRLCFSSERHLFQKLKLSTITLLRLKRFLDVHFF